MFRMKHFVRCVNVSLKYNCTVRRQSIVSLNQCFRVIPSLYCYYFREESAVSELIWSIDIAKLKLSIGALVTHL